MSEQQGLKAQLDTLVSALQAAEVAAEERVGQAVSVLNATVASLEAKLAAAAPHVDIADEVNALNLVITRLNSLQGPPPAAPDPTPQTAPQPVAPPMAASPA